MSYKYISPFEEEKKGGFFGIGDKTEKPTEPEYNYISPFEEEQKEGSSILRRAVGDPLVALARGTLVGIPETVTGLLDIPTMGYAGKTAEAIGKGLGIGGFKEGREFFDKMLTPETQEAQRKVSEAEGFVDTVKTAVQNPSAIAQVVAESIPSMVAGAGAVGKGAKALGYGLRKLSPEITAAARGAIEAGKDATVAETRALNMVEKVQKANLMKAATIGGISEGAVTAGQNLEQVRQDEANPEGTLTPGQIGLNVAAGAITGAIGVLSGKLAARLGLVDPQTFAAMLTTGGIPKTVAEKAKWTKFVADGLKTMAREGFLEELPQSMQEQVAQNLSLGKPIDDQVFQQGALSLLAGMAQAGGAHVLSTSIDRMRSPVHQDIERQLDDLGPEVTDVVKGTPEPVVVAQPAAAPQAVVTEPAATVEPVQAAPVVPAAPAAPVIIPEAIRTEVATMSDRNLAITAEKDREAIVRQAAAEEIQKRAAAPAAAPAAKPAAAPSDIVMKTLEGKTQTQLDTLANEQPDTPIGIAARALWNKNATNAERILKEKEQAATPAAAEKIDYDAQAAAKGISLDNFKKVQNIGELNKWAKEGVEGAQIELARRAQEGLIQPKQITWNIPEAPEAAEAPIPPAAGEPTAQATKGKIPKAAPFAQEVKVKGETQTRIDKVVDYHKNVLGQNLSGEQKLKAEKAIGMQTAAIGRKIEGRPTATEKKVARKKLESLHAGKQVTVNGSPAEVTGVTSYGKHEVKLQDGTMVFAKKSEIQSAPVTNQDVLDHLKPEGLKELEQAESIITPAKKEGEAKYGTAEESGRQTAGGPSTGKERDSVLPEVQKRHGRRVGTLRQVILADASSPADIRKAAGTEGGIVFYPEGYNDPEFQKASDVAGKYGMEAIPIFSESGSVNGMVHRGYVYINMAGGADTTTMETVYHEISHAKGNAETQDKVDTESDAFIQFRTTYSKVRTGKKDTLLPIALVLDEYAAELDSGVKVRFGVNLADGLKPGTSVLPLSESGGKTKASGDISYSIARDKGARILEEGSKKKFKTIFQIANFLSRRVPIDYKTATTAENREVERKLGNFLETSMARFKEAKGWYRKDFTRAMQTLEKLDPAIKKPENNFRMRLAIAIASNGQKSIKTISTAWSAYRNWADNGDFTPSDKSERGAAILVHFNRVNALRSNFKSDLEMEKWLMGVDSLRNIEKIIEVDEDLKLSKGENKDVMAPRASAIFGPKLGAFFNNLSGNFDPVTMDRWFMRTIGRITGTVIKTSDLDKQREAFRNVVTDDVISAVWGNEIGIVRASDITNDELDELALSIVRGKWKNLSKIHEAARLAGNALGKSLQGKLKDSPSSGGEREWIRERVEALRKKYPKFDIADIQAAMWIGEKELYHELGGRREKADYYSEGAEDLQRRIASGGVVLRRPAGATGQVRPAVNGVKQAALFSIRERTLAPGMARQIYDMAISNPDGFTIDIATGGKVKEGYAVSPAKETELAFNELTEKDVYDYIINNGDLFDYDKRAFFGGWLSQDPKSKNFGKFVLDISFVVDNLETAVYLAEHGEQDGIYHIEADNYISTDDGIATLKEGSLYDEGRRSGYRRIRQEMRSIIEGRRPDQGKVDYSVRGTARRTGTGRSQQVRGRVTGTDPEIRVEAGIHYSRQQRTVLDSKFYGTGLADAARLRLPSNQKSPLWQRIYFYYDSPEYGIHPEPGVGTFRHSADFSGLKVYNPYSRQILVSQVMGEHVSNTFEKAILKAGYDGYANPDKGMIVLLGKRKVAVQPADVKYSVREADVRYLELAKDPKKNKAELQKMVDEAAKAAGYNVEAWHGTENSEYSVFDETKIGSASGNHGFLGKGFYFFAEKNFADYYGKSKRFFLSMRNPLVLEGKMDTETIRKINKASDTWAFSEGDTADNVFNGFSFSVPEFPDLAEKISTGLQDMGHDGVIYKSGETAKTEIVAYSPTQIKSADPVTYDDNGNVIPLPERFNPEQADIRYSIKEAAMALPEQIQSLISASLSGFAEHPENLPKAEVAKVVDELKTHKDFSKLEYALSVPARMAQKHPQTWGKLYRIFAVDREETRDELRQEFQKKAEPFLMYDRHLHDKKVPKAEVAASMSRIERVVITGDALAVEFTDEQLTEGINDKYGKEIKLNKDEIAAYRAVRDTLRHIRSTLVNHLANQTLRGYRRNKWFKILEAAVKGDGLNVETLQTLLDKKGMKQAALDRAKKLQPNITKIFDRIEAGVDKIPPQELAKAGKAYEKIANSLQAELTELQGYVSELTGETDKTKLTEMTREIFSAYMQTRPQMKVIRALRNEVGALDGYFPRFRESGDKKFRVYEQEVDENGNIVIDEKTGKEARREVFMKMFSNARQGNEVIKEAMRTLKIKQSDLTPDGKFPAKYFVEIARQTASPESAYQGVNDINLQRLFDDAMRAAQEKGVHGLETTYIDANGHQVDVFEQIRQAGLQSLTNHLKARGAMQRSIKRSEDLIEGYQETDLQRVLLDYITSMSGLMTKQVAASEAMELLSTIKDPFLFSSMARYNREMLRNNSLADRISGYTRSAAFTYFLGGLLKSAVVNLTQNPIVGFAELAKFMREHNVGGAGKSDLLYAKAMKDVLTGNLSEAEKAFIDKMVSRGIASNQFIQSVFENVMNKGLRRHIAVMNFLAKPFSMSEVFNRKSAAIAMYRTAYSMRLAQAKAKGLTGEAAEAEAERMTFDDARDFVTNVHYAYGKTNRPLPIMTGDALGAAAASLYTFKGFSHNFLARQAELLSKGDFRTLGHTLAYLTLFGGLMALPFMRDLFDWWEKEYGYNPMNNVRAMLRGIGGQTLEKFGVSGLPSVLGANFSGSLATGLPWPIGASSPEDSIFGVWAGVATKVGRSAKAFSHGDINRGITEISPEFLRAPRVALRESEIGKQLLGTPGYATNVRGHAILGEDGKPISMSAWEAALKAMGFNPTDYARAKEKTQNIVRQTAWVNDLKQNVAERYRTARLNNDPDATKDMLANVKEVNAKIRSRNLQRLVKPLKVSNVIKSAKPKIGVRQRREMLYKREEL